MLCKLMVYKASTESEARREKIGQARKEFLNIKHGRRPSGEEQLGTDILLWLAEYAQVHLRSIENQLEAI